MKIVHAWVLPAILALFAGTLPAQDRTDPAPAKYPDGAAKAPRGTPQHPDLLRGYAVRPPWKVAGVDYAVGPRVAPTKDPAGLSGPGISVNAATRFVRIDGPAGNGAVIDGYDFSLREGYGIAVVGAANVRISNNKFVVGTTQTAVPISTDAKATNLYVGYNVIDGGGIRGGGAGGPGAIWSLVAFNGSGGATLEYNWLKHAPQHVIEFHSGTLIDRYNLIESLGYVQGAHPNGVQFNGSESDGSKIMFNTLWTEQPTGNPAFPMGLAEAIQVSAQLGSRITNTEVGHNTLIAPAFSSGQSASFLIAFHGSNGANINQGGSVHDNYLDPTGAYGPFYPSRDAIGITYFDNYNMVTGLKLSNSTPQH